MSVPHLEFLPVRSAAPADTSTTLEVLLKITPPEPVLNPERPPLNLGLVLDRSGSMDDASKMNYARDAATFIVNELLPTDRVSLTVFDDQVDVLFPNSPASEKSRLLELIAGITPRNSTDLHAGWAEAGRQVSSQQIPGGLNRILLLTDGLANAGETRPDEIATRVHQQSTQGVSTSTFGLGRHYNENLLESMARSGDGNYYFIESPNQLPIIFGAELRGLSATAGTDVTLEVQTATGVRLVEILNDFTAKADGRLELPHLISGTPIYIVARFEVPAGTGERNVAQFRLGWMPPKSVDRQSLEAGFVLPSVDAPAFAELPANPVVQERAALLTVARQRKQATLAADAHDVVTATYHINESQQLLSSLPESEEVKRELEALQKVQRHLEAGDTATFSKRAKYHSYQRYMSKPYDDSEQS